MLCEKIIQHPLCVCDIPRCVPGCVVRAWNTQVCVPSSCDIYRLWRHFSKAFQSQDSSFAIVIRLIFATFIGATTALFPIAHNLLRLCGKKNVLHIFLLFLCFILFISLFSLSLFSLYLVYFMSLVTFDSSSPIIAPGMTHLTPPLPPHLAVVFICSLSLLFRDMVSTLFFLGLFLKGLVYYMGQP